MATKIQDPRGKKSTVVHHRPNIAAWKGEDPKVRAEYDKQRDGEK